MTRIYEPPLIVELGSVADFTEGNLGRGNARQDRLRDRRLLLVLRPGHRSKYRRSAGVVATPAA